MNSTYGIPIVESDPIHIEIDRSTGPDITRAVVLIRETDGGYRPAREDEWEAAFKAGVALPIVDNRDWTGATPKELAAGLAKMRADAKPPAENRAQRRCNTYGEPGRICRPARRK